MNKKFKTANNVLVKLEAKATKTRTRVAVNKNQCKSPQGEKLLTKGDFRQRTNLQFVK